MDSMLHVWPQPRVRSNGLVELAAVVETNDGRRHRLWYRFPETWDHALTDTADPFAIAALFPAMRQNLTLAIHGVVSPSLLRNLEEFQDVWHCWKPDLYQPVALVADREQEAVPAPQSDAVACFSGGVDACYTLHRHMQGLCGRQRQTIAACLMIHGFDIPLEDAKAFEQAAQSARLIVESRNSQLITMATNWRELEPIFQIHWLDCFGAACITCLSFFQPAFRTGLLASGDSHYFVRPTGSTPLTDPMLSSQVFQVRNDGGAATRSEKIEAISAWPEAMQHLRVCWQGPDKSRNCGRCEKCIRTILNFRAVGQPLPPCFERDVTNRQIHYVPIRNQVQIHEFRSILEQANARGLGTQPWVRILELSLKNAFRKQTLWWRALRRLNLQTYLHEGNQVN